VETDGNTVLESVDAAVVPVMEQEENAKMNILMSEIGAIRLIG
jgi:hypothetical protein